MTIDVFKGVSVTRVGFRVRRCCDDRNRGPEESPPYHANFNLVSPLARILARKKTIEIDAEPNIARPLRINASPVRQILMNLLNLRGSTNDCLAEHRMTAEGRWLPLICHNVALTDHDDLARVIMVDQHQAGQLIVAARLLPCLLNDHRRRTGSDPPMHVSSASWVAGLSDAAPAAADDSGGRTRTWQLPNRG